MKTLTHIVDDKQVGIKDVIRVIIIIFFLSGFSFTNIHYSQDSRGSGRVTPHYHFHPLCGHLDINRAITAENSPLHIASNRTRTGNLKSTIKTFLSLFYASTNIWDRSMGCIKKEEMKEIERNKKRL